MEYWMAAKWSSTKLSGNSLHQQRRGADLVLGFEQYWTPGIHHGNRAFIPGSSAIYESNPKAFGMSGGGGNYGLADQQAGIAAGFVRNHYSNDIGLSAMLVESLYQSGPASWFFNCSAFGK